MSPGIILLLALIIILLLIHWSSIGRLEGFDNDKKGFENIDHVAFVNLSHRKDRLKEIQSEIAKMEIPEHKITRINAVENKDNGHKGCGASHIIALQIAKWNNYRNILILEDDFEFVTDKQAVEDMLTKFFQTTDNKWDVLMFSASPCNLVPVTMPFVKQVKCAATTSGYIVNNHYYDKLIDVFTESYKNMKPKLGSDRSETWAIDQNWKKLQEKDTWYVLNPVVGKQRKSFSDIMQGNVNYGM